MSSRICALCFCTAIMFLTGCATSTKMALQDDKENIGAIDKPVYLMGATLKNDYKPGYQPLLFVVNVEKENAQSAEERINFTMDEQGRKSEGEAGNSYLVRMQLPNEHFVLRGLTGFSGTFPVRGMFFAPLHADLVPQAPGVYYLGHVKATVRERQEGEFRAGPPIPLIDQAVTGFSGGTFDIEIADEQADDEKEFRSRFAALQGVEIKKAILPPFDRAKAQKWWDAH